MAEPKRGLNVAQQRELARTGRVSFFPGCTVLRPALRRSQETHFLKRVASILPPRQRQFVEKAIRIQFS